MIKFSDTWYPKTTIFNGMMDGCLVISNHFPVQKKIWVKPSTEKLIAKDFFHPVNVDVLGGTEKRGGSNTSCEQ